MSKLISVNSVFSGGGSSKYPAHCDNCGPVIVGVSISANVATMVGSSATCPSCGSLAKINDGTYFFAEFVTKKILASGVSKKQAKQFIRKVAKSSRNHITLEAATAINPAFGEIVEKSNEIGQEGNNLLAIAAITVSILFGLPNFINEAPDAYNKIRSVVENITDHFKANKAEPPPKPNWPETTDI